MYSIIFPKTRTAKYADARKVTKAPRRRIPDDWAHRVRIAERFGDMVTADHKVLSTKNKNLDCITDMQWLCKTWRLD